MRRFGLPIGLVFGFAWVFAGGPTLAADTALEPGQARLATGDVVVFSTASPRKLRRMLLDQTRARRGETAEQGFRKMQDRMRRAQEKARRGVHEMELRLPKGRRAGPISRICDDYIAYYVAPRLPVLPPNLKTLNLLVKETEDKQVGSCSYGITKSGLVSLKSRRAIGPPGEIKYFTIDGFGKVGLAALSTYRRHDMPKPIMDYLLIVDRDVADISAMATPVMSAARYLFGRHGDAVHVGLVLVRGSSGSPGYTRPGLGVIIVRSSTGQLLPLHEIKARVFSTEPVATGSGTPRRKARARTSFMVDIHAFDHEVAARVRDGTAATISGAELDATSRRYLDAVGLFAADRWEAETVRVVTKIGFGPDASSKAIEMLTKSVDGTHLGISPNGPVLTIPRVFKKQGQRWVPTTR